MSQDVVKCRYKHCKHQNRELLKEDAVLSGKASYYHADCFEESENIKKIIDVYCRLVDKHPVFTQLRRTIQDLIQKNDIDSAYLLFATEYASQRGWLKHIPGLRYIVKNEEIQHAYQKKITKEFLKNEHQKQHVTDNSNRSFVYVPPKDKTISNMFG